MGNITHLKKLIASSSSIGDLPEEAQNLYRLSLLLVDIRRRVKAESGSIARQPEESYRHQDKML